MVTLVSHLLQDINIECSEITGETKARILVLGRGGGKNLGKSCICHKTQLNKVFIVLQI